MTFSEVLVYIGFALLVWVGRLFSNVDIKEQGDPAAHPAFILPGPPCRSCIHA